MGKKYFLLFLLICIVAASQIGCFELNKKTIRVGTNIWPGYETLHLAKHLGFIPNNIKLIELMSATDVMEAFRLNRLEVAALTMDEAMTLVAEGIDLSVFLVMDVSNGGDKLIARADIIKLPDLKGKTIAYEQTALGALMLHEVMHASELNIEDVTLVHLKINQQLEAFANGSVDALITFEPVATQLLQFNGEVIFDSSHIPNTIVDVLVARKDTLRNHRNLIKILVNGQSKALSAIADSRTMSLEIMSKRMGLTAEQLNIAMRGIHYPSIIENQTLLKSNSDLYDTVERLNAILFNANIIDRPVDPNLFFDDTFVKP
ncbi:ABC transporter substrate-binding protein [Pseudoalteromonas sp. SMS1]|uniref:ABC transporter substrate-binding protein n=1 Tax=Pseudoalteromonas sp. SMS1 TaxID=2908894 RepID=UPI001F236817|nr:ABC transporter substrate-binding protein [Pseudoalteromonas sp. SMS1]MCF2858701.1 ABC transporter substrate-binding protein [Pseudoalteromonas sp. SMS1]